MVLLLVSACSTMPMPPDAPESDAPVRIDAGPPACAVDVVCPERTPDPGAFCEGALSCEYPGGGSCDGFWTALCESGRWTLIEPVCLPRAPPLTGERCNAPFEGEVEGTVSIELPRDRLVIGTQGSPMLALQVRLDGSAAALECIHIEPEAWVDGARLSVLSGLSRRLRCGSTSGFLLEGFWAVDGICDGEPHEVEITIDVQGVGSASASTTITGCD